ncbi:HhH-GPD family protein [Methanobacterium lacus]|uniref:HhH-GPD family protein n=1 Tax=Methanobacterium lacus (strain AL-21) TaxID=877455 RepID=F0T5T7_METLA|nr:endonuclease III [Methanobacterium lacus]ADZ09330.1 HhH-GPD family protein [Methanobacterium lacus]
MNKYDNQEFIAIYTQLYDLYGPQGWWPLQDIVSGLTPTKSGAQTGYHPLDYKLPKTPNQRFEIILGTILTQNTAWTSAEKALKNLKNLDVIDPKKILSIDTETLKAAIKCAGFLNQKANYIIGIAEFFNELDGEIPTRKELLSVKGVGNETADSILLYAYKQPFFVVDAYTKRIFTQLKLVNEKDSYLEIKKKFESNLPQDYKLFNEYHALIVEHAKRYYSKKPYAVNDPLVDNKIGQ